MGGRKGLHAGIVHYLLVYLLHVSLCSIYQGASVWRWGMRGLDCDYATRCSGPWRSLNVWVDCIMQHGFSQSALLTSCMAMHVRATFCCALRSSGL